MNVLIIGKAKTGTTVISKTIQKSISGPTTYHLEPKQRAYFENLSVSDTQGQVVKVIFEHWSDHLDDLSAVASNQTPIHFDKVVCIVRDLRDELISRLLYFVVPYKDRHGVTHQQLAAWLDVLEDKENNPASLSFSEMFRRFETEFGVEYDLHLDFVEETSQQYQGFLQSAGRDIHLLKYEDFIRGDLSGLETYLGLELVEDRDVGSLSRVKRSASTDNWKQVFTAEDIDLLQGRFGPLLEGFGYTDWVIESPTSLDPAHYSQYVARLIKENITALLAGFPGEASNTLMAILEQVYGLERWHGLLETRPEFLELTPNMIGLMRLPPDFVQNAGAQIPELRTIVLIQDPASAFTGLYQFAQEHPEACPPGHWLFPLVGRTMDHPVVGHFLEEGGGFGKYLDWFIEWMDAKSDAVVRYETLETDPLRVLEGLSHTFTPVGKRTLMKAIHAHQPAPLPTVFQDVIQRVHGQRIKKLGYAVLEDTSTKPSPKDLEKKVDMNEQKLFDSEYYRTGCGQSYERDIHWLAFFDRIAKEIQRRIAPKTVLDAGCAMGFLVEMLRDRGIEAFGFDISEYAIQNVRTDIKPHVWQGSITEPLPQRYELITCIEVLEHLPQAEAEKALENLCNHTDDILFSSSPTDYKESTHFNVQPPEYWASLFAMHGFFRDMEFDAGFLTPWAVRFRRAAPDVNHLVRGYERQYWESRKRVQGLQESLLTQEEAVKDLAPQPGALRRVIYALYDVLKQKDEAHQEQLRHMTNLRNGNQQLQETLQARDQTIGAQQQRIRVLTTRSNELASLEKHFGIRLLRKWYRLFKKAGDQKSE